MIEAIAPTEKIRRAYDYASVFYGPLIAPVERKPRMRGLALANIQPSDMVLEVGVGPGSTFIEILRKVRRDIPVFGVDLAPRMIGKARLLTGRAGYLNTYLRVADARSLPFADEYFDVLYSSYLLDLLPLRDIRTVLTEFKRVLKPGGRLLLVNMSKPDDSHMTMFEKLYQAIPDVLVPYLFGGCRPVLSTELVRQVGFNGVRREFMQHIMPSEIVLAVKG